ncbi:hypothetical protein D3C77_761850 [compost metagenome]
MRESQAQGPAQRALGQALVQVVLQVVAVVDLTFEGDERCLRHQAPTNKTAIAVAVDQGKGIDAVET